MHIKINKNYLTYNDYKVKCAVGKRGIGIKKAEGDLITPKGEYKIKSILYRKDREKKLQDLIARNNAADEARRNAPKTPKNISFNDPSAVAFRRKHNLSDDIGAGL